ncbi:MAG TPA: hypothetical protein VK973_06965, partial [Arenicellales bacterium]|nr:hypothetical protein [Arenicellales bacterium]
SFARERGIDIRRGDPEDEVPGKSVIIPDHPSRIRARDVDLDRVRRSLVRKAAALVPEGATLSDSDIDFLAEETRSTPDFVKHCL